MSEAKWLCCQDQRDVSLAQVGKATNKRWQAGSKVFLSDSIIEVTYEERRLSKASVSKIMKVDKLAGALPTNLSFPTSFSPTA
jgi:hypothetical protein